MKSKPLTYFLIAVVLVVWGVIAKKLVTDSAPAPPAAVQPAAVMPADTVDKRLWLNYRDPFGVMEHKTSNSVYEGNIIQPIPEKPVAIPREQIDMRCTGKITKDKRSRYMIQIAGVQHIIMQGEEAEGFRLVSARPDSLRFTKNKIIYTIPTEH